jgi:hypothetical protein
MLLKRATICYAPSNNIKNWILSDIPSVRCNIPLSQPRVSHIMVLWSGGTGMGKFLGYEVAKNKREAKNDGNLLEKVAHTQKCRIFASYTYMLQTTDSGSYPFHI